MESFALFANAEYLKKRAACILTVSDSLVTHEATTSKERQESFQKMMEIALDTAISI
jgi:purine-nucleoside phosphorylase